MSTTMVPPITHPVTDIIDALTANVDALLDARLWTMSDADLLAARIAMEEQAARFTAARWASTGEIDGRGAAVSAGATSTTAWLVNRLRQSPGEAGRELRMSARVTAEALPVAHAALTAGEISAAAAMVIADSDREIARHATVEQREDAETTLTRLAAELPLRQLHAAARRVVDLLDPDQGDKQPKDEAEQYDARFLRLRRNPDGTLTLTGQLDKEAAAELTAAIDPLAKPKPTTDSTGQPTRDQRSPDQRNADALMELIRGEAQAAQVAVTIGLDDLRAATHRPGTLDLGIPLSVAAVRRLACDAHLIPVVLGADGQVLDLGHSSRAVTVGLRRALAVRDRGCAFPGCDRPVKWTHAHHIKHWANGGPTDLDNLVLLCGHHHRAVHHDGWQVRIDPRDRRPTFTPPRWIDPDQQPRRNTRLRT